jgi:hypothetical protein
LALFVDKSVANIRTAEETAFTDILDVLQVDSFSLNIFERTIA